MRHPVVVHRLLAASRGGCRLVVPRLPRRAVLRLGRYLRGQGAARARAHGAAAARPRHRQNRHQGANSYGQLGLGHKEDVLVPQSLKDVSCKCQDIKSITGGGGHSALITGAGELFVCGHNRHGQLGLNHTDDVLHFTLCTAVSGFGVKQVACGWDFTIILVGSGEVLSCGSNSFGQLGVPQISGPCLIPQKIESLKEKVVDVAAGLRHALAATESGLVLQWGTGMVAQAKRANPGKTLPLFLTAKEPCEVTGLEDIKVKTVAASSCHSVSLTDEGYLYAWGSNKHGQLVSKEVFLAEPKKIETRFFSHEKIGAVWSGWTHLVAQTETGKVFTWGRADYGQLGRHAMVPDGQEACTASEQHLELLCNIPVSVPCLNGASQIACGSEHNLAVVGDRCLSWGWNEHGMCGDGTEANVHVPKAVKALSYAKQILIGCGAGHSMALCQTPHQTQHT
ncbi:secretion-regulating guanine nucleotide exchange factor isoform C [Patagioenas fasciata monilis]|uniref:Secretion-regulating guanine nucleotide exchange factor isoform C n=1 Tax=Patagioenas fasciata monilis TaxID=372326 RepID=A0A1V4JNQ6_PATFA|nr:secretion-regulating guanine nucleotide exchange factor isoform C [Patagioenas fasciata monilis]